MNRNNRNIGMALSYAYTFLNMLIGLFMSSFLLRMLGDIEYGLYQSISSFATYLVLLEFGTGTVMSRNVAIANNRDDMECLQKSVTTVWIMNVALAVVICLGSIIFYINIGNIYARTMTPGQVEYAQKIFLWIVGYLVCSFFLQTLNGLLLGMENYRFGQVLNILRLLLRTGMLVGAILLCKYAIVIAVTDCIIAAVAMVVTYIYCKRTYHFKIKVANFDKAVLKESIPLCVALLIQSLVNQANNSVDKFIIGIQMSLEAVALYSVAQYIYSVFSAVTTIPISMYLPQVAKDIGNKYDGEKITQTLIKPSRLICYLGGMILFGFIACGKQFVAIVYGSEKVEAWVYAIIIMIPMLLNMITGPIVNVLDVLNKRQIRSYALLATTVLNVIMTVIFIKYWGIIGAVIATAIATTIGQILIMNIYYSKYLNIGVGEIYVRSMHGVTLHQIMGAIVGYLIGTVISNLYVSFLTAGFLFVITSSMLSYMFGLSKEEKQTIRLKFNSLKRKGER